MKIFQSAIALVAAIATTGGADAAKPKNKQEWKETLDHRMKNGLFDKATLMKKATPHSDAAKKRKLDAVEITGSYSVQFQNCFSLTQSYEEIFDNDEDGGTGMMLMSQGLLLPMRSYSIFRLCYNGACDSGTPMDYVVDLDTYIQALVNYLPTQMENFCEGCQDNYESCMTLMYGGYASAYANGNNNNQNYNAASNNYNGNTANSVNYYSNGSGSYGYSNGNNNNNNNGNANGYNRKLADLHDFEQRVLDGNGQVVKQLDCYLCETYGCLNEDDQNENENDMYGFEAATEWLEELAQCKETGISYGGGYGGGYNNNQQNGDNNQLYGGFLCNAAGTGVEIGLFLDEECVLYLPSEPYSNYMSYFDQTYIEMTKEIIEFTFSSAAFSCKDEEVVYTTQDISGYNMYNGDYNWDQDGGDVAEWCEDLFEGDDSVPVDVSTCGMYNNGNYDNYDNQQNYQEYYSNYQANNDDYQYRYNWYRFEIDEESSLDMYSVCSLMKSSDLHTFYNSDNGNLYNYGSGSASDSISEFLEDTDTEVSYGTTAAMYARAQKLSGVEKFGVVAGTGVLVGAAVALYLKFRSSAEDSKNIALMDDEEDAVEQSRTTGEVA
jgi:hypothetical protein